MIDSAPAFLGSLCLGAVSLFGLTLIVLTVCAARRGDIFVVNRRVGIRILNRWRDPENYWAYVIVSIAFGFLLFLAPLFIFFDLYQSAVARRERADSIERDLNKLYGSWTTAEDSRKEMRVVFEDRDGKPFARYHLPQPVEVPIAIEEVGEEKFITPVHSYDQGFPRVRYRFDGDDLILTCEDWTDFGGEYRLKRSPALK